MATSHSFPPEESLPHPPPIFPQQINAKQAVIYNKSGTKCMNIVKEPSGTPLSPTSPPLKDPGELTPSHSPQSSNGATKKKKKKKGKRKPPSDHIEDHDIANGTHNQHTKSHHTIYTSDFDGEEAVDVDIEDDEEFFSDDEGYDPEAPEIPFPRKDSITNIDDIHNHPHHNHNHKSRKDGIWNTNNNEERQRIREFWLQLGEEERRSLVKVEKEAVLKKMKEQQKHSCSCSVCGRKRTAIEEELETLYDAYYEELELYANQQQQFGSSTIEYRSEHGSDTRKELFNFGNSLTVKGGILTVADDLLKNDGKKFLEMMERLAEQEQRMEEGRRMFQIFAARMFEQRVLNAYREKVAQERQQKLLEELEEENRAIKQQKEEERARKEAERLAEEQALRAEREKKAEEERKKREEERLRKEAERRAREEERLKKEEEKRRKAKEEKEREERKRKEQEARERKEREERERKDREEKARKEKEEKERRQRDERDRKEREAKERRE
ncbi:4488_t:CDS:2, partial [Scutellospora calospora]